MYLRYTGNLGISISCRQYIENAKKAGDSESEKVWNTIKDERQKHTEMLKGLIIFRSKKQPILAIFYFLYA
jgi:hypothetical protein